MDDMTALRTALAVTGLSIALLAVAAPANAAGPSLPDGDTLIAASCLGCGGGRRGCRFPLQDVS